MMHRFRLVRSLAARLRRLTSRSRPATALAAATTLGAALFFTAGCTSPGPYLPQDTAKYTIENTENFVLLDRPTQVSITCTGLQESRLPDGRLHVVANVKNREKRPVQVQISIVFKDLTATSTGDESPWKNVMLSPYETQAIEFTAMNNLAKKYTIRVRQAR